LNIFSRGATLRERAPELQPRTSCRRLCLAAIILAAALYYFALLSNGDFRLFEPEFLDGVYDSVALNLLHGDFTVSRAGIGYEAFIRDGHAYSYFGMFPVVLRWLAMPFMDIAHAHLARLSCLLAIVLFVAFQLRTLMVVHDSLPPATRSKPLFAVMIAATALSGPQIYLLATSWIYHEPIFWSAAFGAAFNLVVVRAALRTGLGVTDMAWLALLAGLALITRPSIGAALYLGTGLLSAGAMLSFRLQAMRELPAALPRMAVDPRVWLTFLILAVFAVVAGVVNDNHFGSPFRFVDFRYYYLFQVNPHRMDMVRTYGAFNLDRVVVNSLYYACGIPWLLRNVAPVAAYLHSHFDIVEAPPSSGLFANPLTIVLAAFGLYRLARRPDMAPEGTAILGLALAGHAAAVLLILAAMATALRYRFDFAPFMTLAALIGYRSLSLATAAAPADRRRIIRNVAVALCVLGIIGSHYVLIVHKVWSRGVPTEVRRALLPLAPFASAPLNY
jgi:hypothetical protein